MVQTGNEFRCGTNANVFITIYGTNGDSGKRPLTQAGRDLFERNHKDNFELEAVDLGTRPHAAWPAVLNSVHITRVFMGCRINTGVMLDTRVVFAAVFTGACPQFR